MLASSDLNVHNLVARETLSDSKSHLKTCMRGLGLLAFWGLWGGAAHCLAYPFCTWSYRWLYPHTCSDLHTFWQYSSWSTWYVSLHNCCPSWLDWQPLMHASASHFESLKVGGKPLETFASSAVATDLLLSDKWQELERKQTQRRPFLEFRGFLQELQSRVREEDAVQHLLEVSLSHTVSIIPPQHIKKTDCGLSLQER